MSLTVDNDSINRISEAPNVLRISENEIENAAINPIFNSNYTSNNNRNRYSENLIRLPSEACSPVSRNVSEISIRSSETRYRESELTEIPKAEIIINSHPIARNIDEPFIPTAESPKRIFRPRFGTPVISPLRKKQGLWGTCACSFCCLLTVVIYFLIPKYPPPKFDIPTLIVYPNNICGLTQHVSLYNDNLYSLQVTNWNINITIVATEKLNPSYTVSFKTANNSVSIGSRKEGYDTLVYNNITNAKLAQDCLTYNFSMGNFYGSIHYKTKLHISYTQNFNQDSSSNDDDNIVFGQISCKTHN